MPHYNVPITGWLSERIDSIMHPARLTGCGTYTVQRISPIYAAWATPGPAQHAEKYICEQGVSVRVEIKSLK